MNPFLITAIAVLGALSFFFLIYLFMIAPSRRGMKKVRELSAYSFAHRGLHSEAVAENSLTAFRLAVEKGYGPL